MVIDTDVAATAQHFGLDPQLLQAMVLAEGPRDDKDAILRAVRCSLPETKDRQAALEIAARSAVHRLCDYMKAHQPQGFAEYFGGKWAPIGAANDPHNLNANWPHNFLAHWFA